MCVVINLLIIYNGLVIILRLKPALFFKHAWIEKVFLELTPGKNYFLIFGSRKMTINIGSVA